MRNKYIFLFIILFTFLSITSCKKSDDNPSATIVTIDNNAYLFSTQTSVVDTIYASRSKLYANLKVTANTKDMGVTMKRLYIFKRAIDDIANPGNYKSIQGTGFTLDGNKNYYYDIPSNLSDSITNFITVSLRSGAGARVDEFYFVYTNETDYAGPASSDGVIIGPAQLYVVYGSLVEYTGFKLYNFATTKTSSYPAFDIPNLNYKILSEAAADIDISENTDNNALFLGKFKSLNNTAFVKAPTNFAYANATDTEVAYYYSQGTAFTETPDSVKIGDIYLIQLRGDASRYAAMKIMYIVPENGKTGLNNDNEYFIFNLKK